MWCVRGFWSCLCCCLSSVSCRAPGALWLCPGSWKQLWPGCARLEPQSEHRSPPGAALGSKHWKCGGDGFMSPVELCWALPLRGAISYQEAPSFHRGRLWPPHCGSLTSPVHGSCLHWEWDQPPRLPEQRVMCVCLHVTKTLTEPWANWVLLNLWIWCEIKIWVWVPKLSTWAGSTNPGSCEGWLKIFMVPEASFLRLCCRLEAKSRELIEKIFTPSWGEAGTCVETSVAEVPLWVTHLVPVWVCSGKLGALGGSQSCTEFTGGWKGEGGLDCLWAALPGRQELWLLLGIFRFSCVIAPGNFPLLLVFIFFFSQINGTF